MREGSPTWMSVVFCRILLTVCFFGGTPWAYPSQRVVLEGILEVAPDYYATEAYYVLRDDREGPVLFAIADPAGRLATLLPANLRCTVEFTHRRYPDDVPLVRLLRVDGSLLTFSDSCSSDPARWAGCDNGLFPSMKEPLPRLLGHLDDTIDPDTDGDGVPDSEDAFPDDPDETTDTDGDGIGNNGDPDDDGDGIPDFYEEANGMDALVNDADEDLDGDGRTNLEEYIADTAANDPASRFQVGRFEVTASGIIRLSWFARADRVYDILSSPDLVEPFAVVPEHGNITVTTDRDHTEEITGVPDPFFLIRVRFPPVP